MHTIRLLALLWALPLSAHAVVYRCQVNGEMVFTDRFVQGCKPITVKTTEPNPQEIARAIVDRNRRLEEERAKQTEAARQAEAANQQRKEEAARQARQQAQESQRRQQKSAAEERKPVWEGPVDDLSNPTAPPGYRLPDNIR